MRQDTLSPSTEPILSVRDLKVYFPISVGSLFSKPIPLKAVDGIDFDLYSGETLGIVGESGCGKSTLGRGVLQLLDLSGGSVVWLGEHIEGLPPSQMKVYRKQLQIIFQDPLASLDPRMTIGDIIAEPLTVHFPELDNGSKKQRVKEMMSRVGLLPLMINRYPHEFSGGQCQRIGVARAMILEPKLIICDEPVSALDVSIQAQIINLIKELQESFGLSLVFISHDLSIVRHISHRIMVLYLGNMMEIADRTSLYSNPRHPYTRALISAVPIPDPLQEKNKSRLVLEGDLPSPLYPPSGCVFRTRCPLVKEICGQEKPEFKEIGHNHRVACHFWDHQL
ncbi:MAG: oligopeptide/dipeptide ABC transporter ATP-binding protein [Desulfocapsaceae bacterium]|jgi:oligopeptide transport system ATP-binding protein|nr:oligopeptide/dipeptide ABC transporter ATP-binding protein [Desulfocapsaceae bacterium]